MGFSNDFGFSFSQLRKFESCPRRWWLEKVQAWSGWNRKAPARARLAYRCKQMTSVFALSGRIVHECAENAIKEGVELGDALEFFETKMRNGWKQARVEAGLDYSDRAKHKTNLFELFYINTGIDDVHPFARAAFDRGYKCVEAIYRSKALEGARHGQVEEVEELRQIEVRGVPVWVTIDLAYRDDDGLLWIWDWKTGKRREDDRDQLALYALYATSAYGISLEDLRLGLAYLKEGVDEEFVVDPIAVERMKDRIEAESLKIRSVLPNPERNEAASASFPETQDSSVCQKCTMFFACKGHRDLSRPEFVARD